MYGCVLACQGSCLKRCQSSPGFQSPAQANVLHLLLMDGWAVGNGNFSAGFSVLLHLKHIPQSVELASVSAFKFITRQPLFPPEP